MEHNLTIRVNFRIHARGGRDPPLAHTRDEVKSGLPRPSCDAVSIHSLVVSVCPPKSSKSCLPRHSMLCPCTPPTLQLHSIDSVCPPVGLVVGRYDDIFVKEDWRQPRVAWFIRPHLNEYRYCSNNEYSFYSLYNHYISVYEDMIRDIPQNMLYSSLE